MIKIKKKIRPDKDWFEKSRKLRKKHCDEYLKTPDDYKNQPSGMKPKKFDFDTDHYSKIKNYLIKNQHDKCCYCERKITTNEQDGDVEHFRPKAGYKNNRKEKLIFPGYYWLTYKWDNLLLSCAYCNRRYKKNLFTIKNNMFRVSSHHNAKNLHKENALLLHPSKDNPEEHITFIREKIIPQVMPTGIESEKGKVTINTCGLERPSLNNSREILFNKIIKLKELRLENEIALKLAKEQVIINIINKNIKHYKTEISDLAKSSSEFAGMVRANFPDLPRD